MDSSTQLMTKVDRTGQNIHFSWQLLIFKCNYHTNSEFGEDAGHYPVDPSWYASGPSMNRKCLSTSSRSTPHNRKYGSAALDWRQQNLIFAYLSTWITHFTPVIPIFVTGLKLMMQQYILISY